MITVHSSAKINLTLDVLTRRHDGYHELQSVIHAVGLWDTLTFDFSFNGPDGFTLRCNDTRLETGDNLIFKALRAWLLAAENHALTDVPRMHVTLEKRIPMGAGMGGGSGNAAATLLALNRRHRDLLSADELLRVAAKVGADVPFFLRGGCALMEGIGEKLAPLPAIDGWLVIVQPPRGLSTPEVFRAWDSLNQESGRATTQLLRAMWNHDLSGVGITLHDLRAAAESHTIIARFDLSAIAAALGNDLATAAQHLGLDVAHLKNILLAHGALGAEMTGSGSAVFGIFADESAAREAAERIESRREKLGLSFVASIPLCDDAVRFPGASETGLK